MPPVFRNPRKRPVRKGIFRRLLSGLRRWFFTGLMITAPPAITIYLIVWIIDLFDGWMAAVVPADYAPENHMPVMIPGLGLAAFVLSLTLLGALAQSLLGKFFIKWSERLVARMPLVSTIYALLKKIFETILSPRGRSFQKAALIEYPRKGVYALVFITAASKGEIKRRLDGKEMVGVFLPTTPNPTSGFLLYVPRSEVIVLDMKVEEAATLIVSAGLVEPKDKRV